MSKESSGSSQNGIQEDTAVLNEIISSLSHMFIGKESQQNNNDDLILKHDSNEFYQWAKQLSLKRWTQVTKNGIEVELQDLSMNLEKVYNMSSLCTSTSIMAILVANVHCILAECVLYNDETDEIVWTDIYGKKFFKLSLKQKTIQFFLLHKQLCSFALLLLKSNCYLCAWEDGFQLYDLEQNEALGEYSMGVDVNPSKHPKGRLNDGRCDNSGKRFICGGYRGDIHDESTYLNVFTCEIRNDNEDDKHVLIHQELEDLELFDSCLGNKIKTANSTCFSNNNQQMYIADSDEQTIYKYKYNEANGTVCNKSILKRYNTKSKEDPDGSIVDQEGYIWNAVWNGARVERIHPQTGETTFTVYLPDSTAKVTCCCFGGKDLDILFITTASNGVNTTDQPNAGGLYAVKLPMKGNKPVRFRS